MPALAGKYDFTMEQGSTFSKTFTYKDSTGTAINLTGYTAKMEVRTEPIADDAIVTLTTENGGITLGGAAGTIKVDITATATAAFDFTKATYDIELITGTTVSKLVYGTITLRKESTRPVITS